MAVTITKIICFSVIAVVAIICIFLYAVSRGSK